MLQGGKQEQDSKVQGRSSRRPQHSPSPSSLMVHSFAGMMVASSSHAGTLSAHPGPAPAVPGEVQDVCSRQGGHHRPTRWESPRPQSHPAAVRHQSTRPLPFKVKGFSSLSAAESLVLSHNLYCRSPTMFYGFWRGSEGSLPQTQLLRQRLLLRGATEKG